MQTRVVVIGAVGVVGTTLLTFAVAAFPFVYHAHIFPLGRLAASIHEGDRFEDVRAKMLTYHRTHVGERAVQFSEFETEQALGSPRPIPRAKGLHLYDVSCFDDVQLSLLFDAAGRVSEKSFIGD